MNQTPKYHYALLENTGFNSALFHEAGKDYVNIRLDKLDGIGGLLNEVKKKKMRAGS